MTKEHDKKVEIRETFLSLKEGCQFREKLLLRAYKADTSLSDVEIYIALNALKKQAGIK